MKKGAFTDVPEKVLYLPELAVEAVVHTDVFHLFSLLPLLPFGISLLLVEVGRVVQVELRDHIQARPKMDKILSHNKNGEGQVWPLWKREELGEEEEDSSAEYSVLSSTQPTEEVIADP